MIKLKRRDIGWKEINEEFTRWELITPFGNVLVHRMYAPVKHEHFHDHPWNFWSIVLWGGYEEIIKDGITEWRKPFSVRYRSAETAHITTTYDKVSWSLCFTGPRIRQWRGDINART